MLVKVRSVFKLKHYFNKLKCNFRRQIHDINKRSKGNKALNENKKDLIPYE